MKYTLSIAACLLFSYSSTLITSDRTEFTRRPYMHSDGTPGVLTMDQGAQDLLRQHPELLPSLLNSMAGEVFDHERTRDNSNTRENSATSPQSSHTRAQAIPTHSAGQPYTGVGRKESVWPRTPSAAESVPQPAAEIAEQKTEMPDSSRQTTSSGESDSDEDDADNRNFIPYRTINIRSTGCWQRVTHRLSSWCCTRKKQA